MASANFLFWNLGKLPRAELVSELVCERDIDVVILAEGEESQVSLMESLSKRTMRRYELVPRVGTRIHTYARSDSVQVVPIYEELSFHLSMYRVTMKDESILLGAVHLPSKLHRDSSEQLLFATQVARDIRRVESEQACNRTVLCGDFNMNPFEPGMVAARGFHSVMSRDIADRRSRTISRQQFDFFYNPMWSQFGDRSAGPPGTYYSSRAGEIEYFWNTFDQVLVRSSLSSSFSSRIEVIVAIGDRTLLNSNGRPDRKVGSDHLPLAFTITL